MKNKDLQNSICHKVAPSKDLTIKPPKLKLHAPKNTSNGPGILNIKFILFGLLNYQFLIYIFHKFFLLLKD